MQPLRLALAILYVCLAISAALDGDRFEAACYAGGAVCWFFMLAEKTERR
jgi:hypothetical protein